MHDKSKLPHMTYTPYKQPKAKAKAAPPTEPPAEPPAEPAETTPPPAPQEQPETDAAPAPPEDPAQPTAEGAEQTPDDPLAGLSEEEKEFFASGEEQEGFSPETPVPNGGGEEQGDYFATSPLEEVLQQVEARIQREAREEAEQVRRKAERGGRPPALDDLNRQLILKLLEAGMSRRQAAKHVGINHTTIANEAKRNIGFDNELREAEMRREYEPLASILANRDRSWRAAAWILERTQPERYGKRIFTQPTPEDLFQVLHVFADLVCEHLQLEEPARESLLTLADALSRNDKETARELLHTAALPASALPAPAALPMSTHKTCGKKSCGKKRCGKKCRGKGCSKKKSRRKKSA